ncbi:hypothetical protein SAMN03159297_05150 [Pseudomonas sp. NFACC45]|nr:hypothetical protein SAMN03159297_05150 [Pseudomonas sp. NFACC45]
MLKLRSQPSNQLVSIKIPARLKAHGRPLLVNLIGRPHIHINPYAEDNMANVCWIPHQLKQDASDFLITYQDIVRPLQPSPLDPHIMQGAHNCKPYNQAEPLNLAHATINSQHQTVVKIVSKRTHPLATTTTTTGCLSLGQNPKWSVHSTLYGAKRLSVGRINGVKYMDGPLTRLFGANLS